MSPNKHRPEVYDVLGCLDAGREIPEDLLIWLPLAEAEELVHYTTMPADVLPSSHPLVGEPTALHLELTDAGRQALRQRDAAHSSQEGGAS